MSLWELIDAVIAKKRGNKEFALFFLGDNWRADIGNDCPHVLLGEMEGEYFAYGPTPEDAVRGLLEKLP